MNASIMFVPAPAATILSLDSLLDFIIDFSSGSTKNNGNIRNIPKPELLILMPSLLPIMPCPISWTSASMPMLITP